MNDLNLINKDESGQETVNARELHSFLGVETRFSDWIKRRIGEFDFCEEEDYLTILKKKERQTLIEYHISIDMAKELSMVERNEKGKQARKYFIECEKKVQAIQKALPNNYVEALQALVVSEQEKAKQALMIEQQAPLIEFCNKLSQSTGALKIGDFAKVLSKGEKVIGQNKLFYWLRENGYLMTNNVPYQKYIDAKLFEVSQGTYEASQSTRVWQTTKITPKGQVSIAKKLFAVEA